MAGGFLSDCAGVRAIHPIGLTGESTMIDLIFVAVICGNCDGLLLPYVCRVNDFQIIEGVIDAPCRPRALSCEATVEFQDGQAIVWCTGPVSQGLLSDSFES